MKTKLKRKLKQAVRKAATAASKHRLLRPVLQGVYEPQCGESIQNAAKEAIAQSKKQRIPDVGRNLSIV